MRDFLKSFRPIAVDFLSTIIFIAVYEITGNVVIATAVGIVTGIAQFAWLWSRGTRMEPMQWASLALVVVLGGATLVTRDPRFVMLKPTIAYIAVACVMLQRGWQSRYFPEPVKLHVAQSTLTVWGYVWSALYFTLAAANLFIAWRFGLKVWAPFSAFVPVCAMIGLFLIQYVSLRAAVIRRLRAGAEPPKGTRVSAAR